MKAQALAKNPIDQEYEPLKTYFPDEEISCIDEVIHDNDQGWMLFFDGASNRKGIGIGAVLMSESGKYYPLSGQLRFHCTNNMSEYEACIFGLRLAVDMGIQKLHIPKMHNEIAYALATLSSMLQHPDDTLIDPLYIQIRDQHAYCNMIEEEFDGYHWLTMERDSIRFVCKCHECQIHGNLIHFPPSELHEMSAPWPFVAWGMYVIGLIEPKASNGHRFILVAIDYFTKWVEAVTFKSVTKKVVVDFIHFNIICRFGIPKVIITDNVANLNSHLIQEVCYQFKIEHRNSTPYRPKDYGAVEASKKNMKKILRKMVQSSRQWHEKLPFALLGYRTIVRTSVGATPYSLVYGTETVIPIEIEISSLRIVVEAEIDDDEWIKTRLEQLGLIDEASDSSMSWTIIS
ncbi:uncharacterized protein [Solanum lycopersicum]|uniref:uncharacterized protein n=1 Tax=Solanum lycopersicum TaxID=4081 RepID=UPI000532FC35|nr:uncharacterized protein LOC104649565 [Solanum lycopersicum]